MIYEEVLKAEEKLNQCINWETGEIEHFDGTPVKNKKRASIAA